MLWSSVRRKLHTDPAQRYRWTFPLYFVAQTRSKYGILGRDLGAVEHRPGPWRWLDVRRKCSLRTASVIEEL